VQSQPPDALHLIVYLDYILVNVLHNGSVINKAVFLALGMNTEGQKELLGMWDAINSVYSQTHIQLCIVHRVRNSLSYTELFTGSVGDFSGPHLSYP